MEPIIVLAVHCTLSLFTFWLIGKWYVVPRLNQQNKYEILSILLIINVFRYLPLSLYMPGQVSPEFPAYVKDIIAHGDFLSGMLALIAVLLLKSGKKWSIAFVWLFSVVSIADIILALSLAMSSKVYELSLGANYFTVVVYVPLLMVVQVLILKILLNKSIPA